MPDLKDLNPEQRQAATTVEGPVLILAGAGTGKTRVITYRIAHLLDQGIRPGHILAVTFTNKAAREMQSRVSRLLSRLARSQRRERGSEEGGRASNVGFTGQRQEPEAEAQGKPERPTICTFHSLCVRILRRYAERLGYKRNFVIYDQAEQLSTIKKILSHITGPGVKVDPGEVLAMLSRHRNGGTRGVGFAGPAAEMAEHIRRRYEAALHACNAMDFDDLILLVLRLFEEHPGVLAECRERYRYVMVDEYQDTNAAQFRLVHALTREHRNLCVVGDDDQSIYGWRGAEVANLLDMERHYPEVKVVKLEQNYRSTSAILEAANALIHHNPQRRGKRLWSRNGAGSKLELEVYGNEEEEARAVVDQIEFSRSVHRVPWRDQAVLFRTNGQSRPLETALRQTSVRYHLVGGQSFFDRREVRDFLAYLKVFLNPHDDISLLRIANVPARGLSETTMERLLAVSHQRKSSVFSVMRGLGDDVGLGSRARSCVRGFINLVETTQDRLKHAGKGFSLRGWADAFLRETGYVEDLRRSEKDPEAGENRVRNLLDLAASLDADQGGVSASIPIDRLQAFLEDLMLDQERKDDEENAGDVVTLITMHSCKGLEFPHVHIVGLEEGLLPHSRSKEEGTLDEERRLLYVAMTRAMKTLSLSHCAARRRYGQFMPMHPSRFLGEVPAHLVESGNSRRPVSVDAGKSLFAGLKASLNELDA
jgi:superfamily I DNA/RNA helicase